MSMQTDIIYGYGFRVYASDEALKGFILRHKDVVLTLDLGRRLVEYCESTPDDEFNPKEDFFDYESLFSSFEGVYGVIADVMYKETGIRFEYKVPQEEDGEEDDCILLPETYPWNYNEKEKALTEESLNAILKGYIEELGGQLIPEYIRLEYFG